MFKVSCVSSVFSSWSVSTSPRQYSRIVPALDHWHLLSRDYVLIYSCIFRAWASLLAQLVKNLPAMQETLVQILDGEDPLEKGEAAHSSILGLPLWLSW